MLYSEIVERVNTNQKIKSEDVTGVQLIHLLYDKTIKQIKYHKITYEVNFVPITYSFEPMEINDKAVPTFDDANKIIEHWIHCYDANKDIYIIFNENHYQVVLDILETE